MSTSPEDIPLQAKSSEAPAAKSSSSSGPFVLTRLKALLILLALVGLVVIIIILAVLLGVERAEKKAKAGVTDKEGSDTPTKPSDPPGPWDNIRLPRSVLPSHYDIHLNVDPNKEGFTGSDKITVNVVNKTSHIFIHSNRLNITKATLTKKGSGSVGIKKQFHVKKTEFLVMETDESLEGQYVLEFEFSGFYRKGLFGLFKGVYRQNSGKTAAFLSTQFQPLDARTMFPCFDEPSFKATFKISLAYPEDMVGLSNNVVDKEETKDKIKTTYYKITPKMSSYLVSVVVGHFDHKELITPSGVKLRAFAQPGNQDQMDFALESGNNTLTQMENVFGIKYTMPKLDFVAPPECFIAMENWGSIRFEEDGLLYKNDFSSEEIQQNLLIRWLPHEIIHMWFGNYVTTKWWNDLWLNEAVTDFFTYHEGSPNSLADWKLSVQFFHTNLGYALGIDGLVNTRPVVQPTEIPNWDTFDNIVYKKGSSLLNMVKHLYPKKQNYIKGMKNYLNKFAYGNAIGSDMWDALQSTCPLNECANFKEIMKTWMTETNYPVLTIKKSSNGKYIVQQERFVYDKTAKVDKRMWVLRFSYITSPTNKSSNPSAFTDHAKWMNNPADKTPLETMELTWNGKGLIKGNFGQKGFYRVNYDDTTWGLLSQQLSHSHFILLPPDRYGLIDDAFNLARGERVSIKRAMDMTRYITKERDYIPWMAVYKNVQYIVGILPTNSQVNQLLKKYLAHQSKSFYNSLGLKNTGTHLEKLLRRVMVEFQCQSGSTSCLGNMTMMFNEWKKDPMTKSVTPALRSLLYFYGVRQGSNEDWKKVLNQLYKNTIASEYQTLLMGLAGTHDIGLLNRYLVLMHNESIVKQQYLKYVLEDVANHNPIGADVMWSYINFNWDKLKGTHPVDTMLQYLQITTRRFSTADKLQDLEKFINENLDGKPMPRLLRKTVEIVKLNIAWRKAHESDLEQWLKDFFKSEQAPTNQPPGFGDSS